MSTVASLLDDYPRKLIYFGSDSEVPRLIESKLGSASADYSVKQFNSWAKLQVVDLTTYCHALILDMRGEPTDAAEIISRVGELQCPVALICFCGDFSELGPYEDQLHLINDIVIPENLADGELHLRILRAVKVRRADLERREDQELLFALLDNVPDSIYFKDRNCRFIRVNAAKARKHETSPGSMVGKTDFDFFTEERARPAYEEEQGIMRTGEPVLGEVQKLTFDDGSVCWVNTSKLPLTDKYGHVIGTMGISRDVTAQKEGERDQELLNELLDSIPDAIYFKDRKSRFIRVNKAMAETLGQGLECLVGKSDFDLFTEDHAKRSFADEREIMKTGKSILGKVEKETFDDGSVRWVNTTKVPLHNKDGEIIGTMGISRNVTEQMVNEQKLKAAEEKLDRIQD